MVQVTTDRYGIDPLIDGEFDTVNSSQYREISIDSSMEGNPQRVSFEQYGTNKYWRLILIANGLAHSSELKAGFIKVPVSTVNKTINTPKVVTTL